MSNSTITDTGSHLEARRLPFATPRGGTWKPAGLQLAARMSSHGTSFLLAYSHLIIQQAQDGQGENSHHSSAYKKK